MPLKDLIQMAKRHTGKLVLPIVDRYLLERNYVREEIEQWLHPSGMCEFDEMCARELFLSRFTPIEKYPKNLLVNSHSPRTHRIFDNGTAVHLRWQWYFIESGLCSPIKGDGWEIPIENKELGLRGHADGVIYPESANKNRRALICMPDGHGGDAWPVLSHDGFSTLQTAPFIPKGEPVLVELKSMNDRVWSLLHEPLRKHRVQALCYMGVLRKKYPNLKRCIFIYENKSTQEVKEYEYPFKPTLWAAVSVIFNLVERSHHRRRLPKRICKSKMSEKAIDCRHVKTCFAHKNFEELIQIDAQDKKTDPGPDVRAAHRKGKGRTRSRA